MCVVGNCRIENKKFVFGWLVGKENGVCIKGDRSDRDGFLLKEVETRNENLKLFVWITKGTLIMCF